MEQKKIDQYVELLADNMALMANYARFAGSSKKMLIVEGATDEKFIQKLLNNDIWCVTAQDAFSNEDCFFMSPEKLKRNNKKIIINVVYGLAVFPTLINTRGLDGWNVYGMIDMDFDSESEHTNTSKLFVTDTHDLETLLLSTDGKVLGRLDKCTISDKEVSMAYFVAYQLGVLRSVILDVCGRELSVKPIAAGGMDVEYGEFLKECKICIPKLMHYINSGKMNNLSISKINQMTKKIQEYKSVKKSIDDDGYWIQNLEDFKHDSINGFWNIVNGHDILALLRYYNENTKRVYSNKTGRTLNREFECDLIEKYDYDRIQGTVIYKNMVSEAVING